jgi:hypothetical protein
MVTRALCLLLVIASGCYDDRYRCVMDSQCDLGEGGRCEVDGYCTYHDITCSTRRRYAEHAGALTAQCFDDRNVPINACAGGQPPAKPEGCFATVCERLPVCCNLGWIDACAQAAQAEPSCGLRCDTRIAITATRNAVTEMWDVRYSGEWSIEQRTDVTALAWVGPVPGTSEPRLATATATALVIGESSLPIPEGRDYNSITSAAFDRDGRDTIAAGYTSDSGNYVELWKMGSTTPRETRLPSADGLAWGDKNRDDFPDGILKNGGQYVFLDNLEDDTYTRKLSNQTAANVSGGNTPGAPGVRSFDWLDLNGDTELDLVVFGASLRIHTNADGLRDAPERDLDCDPPAPNRPCAGDPEPNLESAAFGGCALPTPGAPTLVASVFPGRKLFRIQPNGDASRLPFPGDGCNCTSNCNMGSCTYNCQSCVPVIGLVARDLDHDHVLDLIAIDARLNLFIALGADDYQFTGPTQIPTTFTSNTFFSVDVSVTGAPIP